MLSINCPQRGDRELVGPRRAPAAQTVRAEIIVSLGGCPSPFSADAFADRFQPWSDPAGRHISFGCLLAPARVGLRRGPQQVDASNHWRP